MVLSDVDNRISIKQPKKTFFRKNSDISLLKFYVLDHHKSLGYHNTKQVVKQLTMLSELLDQLGIDTTRHLNLIFRDQSGMIYHDWKVSAEVMTYLLTNAPRHDDIQRMKIISILFN